MLPDYFLESPCLVLACSAWWSSPLSSNQSATPEAALAVGARTLDTEHDSRMVCWAGLGVLSWTMSLVRSGLRASARAAQWEQDSATTDCIVIKRLILWYAPSMIQEKPCSTDLIFRCASGEGAPDLAAPQLEPWSGSSQAPVGSWPLGAIGS